MNFLEINNSEKFLLTKGIIFRKIVSLKKKLWNVNFGSLFLLILKYKLWTISGVDWKNSWRVVDLPEGQNLSYKYLMGLSVPFHGTFYCYNSHNYIPIAYMCTLNRIFCILYLYYIINVTLKQKDSSWSRADPSPS